MLAWVALAWGIEPAVTVGPGGDYPDLDAAWADVTTGMRIRLLPGDHELLAPLDTGGRDLVIESADPTNPAQILVDLVGPSHSVLVAGGDFLNVRHVAVSCLSAVGGFDVYGSLRLEHVAIEGCTSPDEGGAVLGRAGSEVATIGGRMTQNTAANGGAVYAGGSLRAQGTAFEGNVATNGGGGIRMGSGLTNTVRGSTFRSNDSPNGGGSYITGSGGASWVGNRFEGNSGSIGGGLKHSTPGPADIRYNHFAAGTADTGGGIMLFTTGAVCEVEGNRFLGNQATTGGNLHVRSGGTPECLVRGNRIEEGQATENGGGVFIGQPTGFAQNLVCGNAADGFGGGIYTRAETEIEDSVVLGNVAQLGGSGVDIGGGAVFHNNAVAQNGSEAVDGSAVRAETSPGGGTVLRDNFFSQNPGQAALFEVSGPFAESDFNAFFETTYTNLTWNEGPSSIALLISEAPPVVSGCSFTAAVPDGNPLGGAGSGGEDIGIRLRPELLDNDEDGYFGLEDCNDDDRGTHPGADESCEIPGDEDCDGLEDGDDPGVIDGQLWYFDADGDGAGVLEQYRFGCAEEGWAELPGDCAPDDPGRSPLLEEIPGNAVDEDCDGVVWCFHDIDLDGWGHLPIADIDGDGLCESAGESTNGDDCNDEDADVRPDAQEVCNGIDDDCDGDTDAADPSATGTTLARPDLDQDGFGRGDPVPFCIVPTTHSTTGGDCNDNAPAVHPGATEICNGIDDDCDQLVDNDDPDVTGTVTGYLDGDSDGFGAGAPGQFCTLPVNRVGVEGDCDDADPSVYPGAPELCDGLDNDCDAGTPDDCPEPGDTGETGVSETGVSETGDTDVPVHTGLSDTSTEDTGVDTDVPLDTAATGDTAAPPHGTGDTADVPIDTDIPVDTDTDIPIDTDTDVPDTDTDVPDTDTDAPSASVYVRGPGLCASRTGAPLGFLALFAGLLARRR